MVSLTGPGGLCQARLWSNLHSAHARVPEGEVLYFIVYTCNEIKSNTSSPERKESFSFKRP